MTDMRTDEITPEQLMEPFRNRSLKSIVVFTVAVHLVVLLGTSVPFLWETVAGGNRQKLSEEQRVEVAMREATASLREIADKHGLKPQDLGERLAGGAAPRPQAEKAPVIEKAPQPEPPKSSMEKEIDVRKTGPEVPNLEKETEDLFK